MNKSAIDWTDYTWNPTTGCSKVSLGCQNCYAERISKRFAGSQEAPFKVTLHPNRLDQPLKIKRPSRIFVDSMGDLFHDHVRFGFLDRVFDVVTKAERHTFQVLTKRPERAWEYLRGCEDGTYYADNLWLGVSVEDQARADERIPLLLQTPAAVRFVSLEPLLGPVDLGRIPGYHFPGCTTHDVLRGRLVHHDDYDRTTEDGRLDWVIMGAETGPRARPCNPEWVQSIIDQCRAAGVPSFVKSNLNWPEDIRKFPGGAK